jgi:hypothetical protein
VGAGGQTSDTTRNVYDAFTNDPEIVRPSFSPRAWMSSDTIYGSQIKTACAQAINKLISMQHASLQLKKVLASTKKKVLASTIGPTRAGVTDLWCLNRATSSRCSGVESDLFYAKLQTLKPHCAHRAPHTREAASPQSAAVTASIALSAVCTGKHRLE